MHDQLSLFPDATPSTAATHISDLETLSSEAKTQKLKALHQACKTCVACPLHTGRTHSVFSDGNPEARIMIVGEGPGYHEDQSGVPFVGRSGQLLNKMLAAVQLERERDVYIANVVKCRPPDNRKPTVAEMQACFDYLKQQIEWVQPRILVLTGATALQGVTGIKKPISRSRGTWVSWRGIDCMPIFHPAYLLRNDSRDKGSPKWHTWQDLKAIATRYRELNP